MPEGLTPHAIAPFNYALDVLIQNYTLKGIPVLVHCRGGVGRAGLVTCCWLIKVGLCGWLEIITAAADIEVPIVPIVPNQTHIVSGLSRTNASSSDPYINLDESPCQSQSQSLSSSQSQDFSIINNSSPAPTISNGTVASLPAPPSQSTSLDHQSSTKVPTETLDLVQKAIAVVRRRRSVKAIETYEQVKFLVGFVEFLRSGNLKDNIATS
jgi:hypothetical protein